MTFSAQKMINEWICSIKGLILICILCSILMFGIPAIYKYTTSLFSFYNWEVFPYITPCVYAIGLNAQTTSAYLTLCVTLERYVAVCQPLKVNKDKVHHCFLC